MKRSMGVKRSVGVKRRAGVRCGTQSSEEKARSHLISARCNLISARRKQRAKGCDQLEMQSHQREAQAASERLRAISHQLEMQSHQREAQAASERRRAIVTLSSVTEARAFVLSSPGRVIR